MGFFAKKEGLTGGEKCETEWDMSSFHELIVWQRSMGLAKRVYALTATFPRHQRFGLCDQMERAAVSVISNIAEGSRRTRGEWLNFLRIALGSISELDAQMRLSMELGFGDAGKYQCIIQDIDEISRMLSALIWKLTKTSPSKPSNS